MPIDAKHQDRIDELFDQVESLPPAERAAFLDEACVADPPSVRAEVERLLAASDQADKQPDFLRDSPFFGEALPDSFEKPGSVIGNYKLLQQIGEGGFGIVFMADQLRPVQRRVALKIIKPGMDSKQVIARFEAERQALALMDHPNIAKVFDAGTTDTGRPYFVMELVKGISITRFCDEQELSVRERLELFVPICKAIQHAHQKGIIHRDIKPSNLLLSQYDGEYVPKVIDFGVAKAINHRLTEQTMFTQFGQVIGTLQYMSPEQSEMNQLDVDTRSDIYSLGTVLYELITGSTPIEGKRLQTIALDEMLRLIRDEDPPRPSQRLSSSLELAVVSRHRKIKPAELPNSVRGELDSIVMMSLDKQRARRYETANDFARDVQRYLANEPVEASPPSASYVVGKFVSKHSTAIAMASALVTVLCLATAISTWQAIRANRLADTAFTAETNAKASLERAQVAERKAIAESKRRLNDLVRTHISTGARLMEEDDYPAAMLYFSEALRLAPGDEQHERFHRMRCASTFQASVKPIAMWDTEMRSVGMVVSDDEKYVATFNAYGLRMNNAGEARVWDIGTGKLLATLRHEKDVHDAAFSPDRKYVATASGDRTARLWELATGQPVGPVLQHALAVSKIAFSHKGDLLATGTGPLSPWSEENLIRQKSAATIWRVPSGDRVCEMPHGHVVHDLEFSPDDQLLATASGDATVGIWDSTTGQPDGDSFDLSLADGDHPPTYGHLRFVQEGKRLVVGTIRTPPYRCWVCDLETREVVLGPFPGTFLDVDDAGTKLLTATSGDDGTGEIHLWSLDESRSAGSAIVRADYRWFARLSPSGSHFIFADRDGTQIRAMDTASRAFVPGPLNLSGHVRDAKYLDGDRRLLILDSDSQLTVWDLASKELATRETPTEANYYPSAFNSDPHVVSLSTQDRRFKIVNASSGEQIGSVISARDSHKSTFNPTGTRLLTYGRGNPQVWEVTTGRLVAELKRSVEAPESDADDTSNDLTFAAFDPVGRYIATAAEDGVARIWDATSGAAVSPPLKHASELSHVSFNREGSQLVVCAGVKVGTVARNENKGDARIYAVPTGKTLTSVLEHNAPVSWAAFSPDSQQLLTCCAHANPKRCTAQVWDVETGQQLATMQHRASVLQGFFLGDGSRVITGSEDGTARVWNSSTGQPATPPITHGGSWGCQMLLQHDILLVTTSHPSNCQLWNSRTGQPLTVPMRNANGLVSLSSDCESLVSADEGRIQLTSVAIDDRSIEQIIASAEVLSGYRLDTSGGRVPLTASELRMRFKMLFAASPDRWNGSGEQVAQWKSKQADWHIHAAGATNDPHKREQHLSRVLGQLPAEDVRYGKALADRGKAWARMGRWDEALRDLKQANLLQPNPRTLYETAQIYAKLGRTTDHRLVCEQMAQTFDLERDTMAQYLLADTCVLFASSFDEWDRLARQLKDTRLNVQRNRRRAAVLFRAEKFEESLALFASLPVPFLEARDYLFQSMAHAALGQDEMASAKFAAAEAWLVSQRHFLEGLGLWQVPMETDILRKEASNMLPPSAIE